LQTAHTRHHHPDGLPSLKCLMRPPLCRRGQV
jgi:hypothetical protein